MKKLLGMGLLGITLLAGPAMANTVDAVNIGLESTVMISIPMTKVINGVKVQGEIIGSGVIVNADGTIVTNEHVIGGEEAVLNSTKADPNEEITVTFSNGDTARAHITKEFPSYDLALIKVDTHRFMRPIVFGDASAVVPGAPVIVIGSPKHFQNTVTKGIVSAIGREPLFPEEQGTLTQMDAATNPGNSGGPLLDEEGHLIGIVNSSLVGAEGMHFAIDVQTVRRVLRSFVNIQEGL